MPPAPDSGVVEVLGLAALPLTALNDALRAHMLQGAGQRVAVRRSRASARDAVPLRFL